MESLLTYQTTERMRSLYLALQDDLSKQLFTAQLRLDTEDSVSAMVEVDSLASTVSEEEKEERREWKKRYAALSAAGEKIILYGTGAMGQKIASMLLADGLDFYGFCGRRASAFPNGLMGKPVVSPEWLFAHKNEIYVAIATILYFGEIYEILLKNRFSEDRILPWFLPGQRKDAPVQYFEFPELFPKGTAFADGGCYNGQDSVFFARWCGGDYSKILAFEPDERNCEICEKTLAPLRDVAVIKAGLSDAEGSTEFVGNADGSSFIVSKIDRKYSAENAQTIRTVRLDDVIGKERVGMIKMDIEGAEYDALHGAEQTIRRDKPFLAICIYHKPGDMLAIMDYCKQMVPEYRFWLRHYGFMAHEVVLYAAI